MSKKIVKRQFINIFEHNKYITDDKWNNRIIFIIERLFYNDGTSEKVFTMDDDPTIRFYHTVNENSLPRPSFSVREEDCELVETKFNFATRASAQLTDQMSYYQATSGFDRKRVHLHKDLHGSDTNIVDHYIKRYFEEYEDEISTEVTLTKGFYDIEVDAKDLGDFPNENVAPVPINLINYFYDQEKVMHVFMNPFSHLTDDFYDDTAKKIWEDPKFLKSIEKKLLLYCNFKAFKDNKDLNEDYKLIPADLVQPNDEVLDKVKQELKNKSAKELKEILRCYNVKIHLYDNELDLIADFLDKVVNIDKPDTMMAWNDKFDILTIQNRLYRLGVDPEEYFTPEDFKPYGLIDYKLDTRNDKIPDKKNKFICIGYSIWIDQQILFASLRKQMGLRPSYSLDAIIRSEIDEEKFNLGNFGGITEVPYKSYEAFLIYGALDVIPMYSLEDAVGDVDAAYQISLMTRSEYHKNMTKTNILKNFADKFYKDYGLILSNNRNAFNETSKKFRGALTKQEYLKVS